MTNELIQARIDRHLRQLAPHVAGRETALLLREASDEIERLRRLVGGEDDLSQRLVDRVENLHVQAVREIVPGWVGIPTVEWDSIMTPNANVTGLAPIQEVKK